MGLVKVTQSCPILCDPMNYTVHGILQVRILETGAFPFSRGSSQPRDRTQVSHTAGRFFTSRATREALVGLVEGTEAWLSLSQVLSFEQSAPWVSILSAPGPTSMPPIVELGPEENDGFTAEISIRKLLGHQRSTFQFSLYQKESYNFYCHLTIFAPLALS